ncbi:hypothetical protein HZZ00_37810 (plasmid) [Streptomyces sp. NEAU-sy36]|uniref:hypothetical protein n=1 Tax=unclassified Streptomyces TaxID=2593676 RepID=UPI0015D62B92|nr:MULTISPECIES: hypothetical protein [unclassified Streptomyces]QLJ06788.1 hypothetical protein HZZ00_37810 [Streptomyces sp. NEAU-sy36]
MATRTRKTTTKQPPAPAKKTARKPAAKKTLPTVAPVNRATVVDLRRPLPVRRRAIVGPMGSVEQAAIRAALAAAAARLPVPVRAWHGPTAHLHDGTVLTHTPAHATTDQQPAFHAAIRCPHGAIHAYTIHTAQELTQARQLTADCNQRTTPEPTALNPAVRALGDALTRAKTASADTQPLDTTEIAAGLTVRADHENPKEHPHRD